MAPKDLSLKIAQILDSKKADKVATIDLANLSVIADYFVVASANNSQQLRALSDEVEEKLAAEGLMPTRVEGYRETRWIVMDYGSVIVHLFHYEEREFYNIERLWAEGSNITYHSTPD